MGKQHKIHLERITLSDYRSVLAFFFFFLIQVKNFVSYSKLSCIFSTRKALQSLKFNMVSTEGKDIDVINN